MYTKCRGEGALETSLCQRGVAQRAQKHLANGGQGKGRSLSPLNSHPSQTNPLMGVWGQREREERLPLDPSKEDGRGGVLQSAVMPSAGGVLQSSVMPLALSSSCTLVR